jgi:predicted amidophosphoribosyltransferase
MQAPNSVSVEIQDVPVHCPLCHKESTQSAYLCPGCKRLVVTYKLGPKFCVMCGTKLTD